MKSLLPTFACRLLILFICVIFACNKSDQPAPAPDADPSVEPVIDVNFPTTDSSKCPNAPNYGDSIVYLQSDNGHYTLQPINNSGVQGTYMSWPEGLDINPATGVINMSQSETGVRYYIGFAKKGTNDTCVSKLILGGLSYIDSIHVLSKNDTLAAPIFNANPNASPICNTSDDSDYPDGGNNGNNNCHFDDDVNGQRANDQKLRVRTVSGVINLKKSLADGLFGPHPKNGESKKVKITYRLNDGSKMSKQKVTVQVMYYDKVSSIPNALKNEVANKRKNAFSYKVINGKPRPPLLVIAGLAN